MTKLSYTMAAFVATFIVPPQAHLSLIPIAAAQAINELVGRWEGQGLSDSGGKQYIVLELRADGTYTKTLDAVVNGQHYGARTAVLGNLVVPFRFTLAEMETGPHTHRI